MSTECVVVRTPFTKMALMFDSDILVAVDLFSRKKLSSPESGQAKYACQQVRDYCSNQLPDLKFDIKLKITGTAFQKKVWRALQKIPAGQILTYGELAQQLKTSARAVGNACRANPIPLVIPCHRVVAKSGMGGFAGSRAGMPMKIKMWLLEHEGVPVNS
ncbi:MAG: methylated-DNA--[protein]-cysteine S-methyltransferase [Gammaproteobacteria bacterium]|nr:methylated-DNA--[protein]-cysteine S-methyltransferase [Gammaproteobacteria bacterium]